MILRTSKHVTLDEAHPYHGYVLPGGRVVLGPEYRRWSDSQPGPVGTSVAVCERYDPRCPLCRETARDTIFQHTLNKIQ